MRIPVDGIYISLHYKLTPPSYCDPANDVISTPLTHTGADMTTGYKRVR